MIAEDQGDEGANNHNVPAKTFGGMCARHGSIQWLPARLDPFAGKPLISLR
ncbi:MAG: hypothetical protein V4618_16970 [Pseudomonadota bacterium]